MTDSVAQLDAPEIPQANLPSAPPAETGKTAKEVKAGLPKYPNIPKGGLESMPADFDQAQHAVLRAKDFVSKLVYLEAYKRPQLEKQLARIDADICEEKDLLAHPEKAEQKRAGNAQARRLQSMHPDAVAAMLEVLLKSGNTDVLARIQSVMPAPESAN